jgi:hypothetical protein
MAQGILLWLVTFLLAYFIINSLSARLKFIDRKYLTWLFLYHTLLTIAYYMYALFNPSDSKAYYKKVLLDYRGSDWASFYGTSTTFIEFFGYPFIKYMGFTYESMMVLFSFLGFLGFLFFYVFFKERVKMEHYIFSISFFTLIFFLPNLHFWSSSFGKGSIIFCGFGLFFFALNKPLPRLWALLAGGYIIYMVRPHIFFVILIAIGLGYTFSTKGVSPIYRILILAAAAFILYYIYEDILKITGLEDDSLFEPDFSERADRLTKATSGIDIANYSLPEKMFAFWFRPLFFDAPGLLGIIVSFENVFYLLVFAYLLQPKAIGYLFRADALTKTCLLTFLGVSFALAQISGNLGLAMRQKSQVMILMLFVILKFMDEQKILQVRSKLSRNNRLKLKTQISGLKSQDSRLKSQD